MKRKDLLGLKDLAAAEIIEILDLAAEMKKTLSKREKRADLAGKTVMTLFYENSTRTRVSFETAAKQLCANTSSISAVSSSVQKGESLIDTAKNLEALLADYIVIRHPVAGAPELLARNVNACVINGGDGMNEHPTQALLDIFTMRERFGSVKGLKVAICGDIKYSRVARSNIWGLSALGANVTVFGPKTLLPAGIENFPCKLAVSLDAALKDASVVMGLRIQSERQKGGAFPNSSEYAGFFGIGEQRLRFASSGALVMHPGPVNRGIEMSSGVIDSENSVILDQVTNGLAVRMSVLSLLKGGKKV